MKRSLLASASMAALIAGAGTAGAGTAEAQVSSAIEWKQIVALVGQHPGTAGAKVKIALASAAAAEAKQVPNPDLDLEMGQGIPNGPGDAKLVWSLSLTVPLGWTAKHAWLAKAGALGVEAAGWQAEAARLEILLELRRMFLAVARDQAIEAMLEARSAAMRDLAAAIEARVAAQESAAIEMDRLDVEIGKIEVAEEKASVLARLHREQLALWLGGELPEGFTVGFEFDAVEDVPDLGSVLEKIAADHPLVLAAAAAVGQAEANVGAQKGAAFPDLSAGAFFSQETDLSSWGGIIGISLPLWNWNKGGVALAKAELAGAKAEESLVGKQVQSAAVELHASAEMWAEVAISYRDEIVPAAVKAASGVEKAFLVGEADLLDVIDARRWILELEEERLEALHEHHQAIAGLEALEGRIGQ